MAAALVVIHPDDQIAEAIHDPRQMIEVGSNVYHAKHPEPLVDTVELAQLCLQACQHGQRRKLGCLACLLRGDIADSAYRGLHFGDAVRAKGGTPRVVLTAT